MRLEQYDHDGYAVEIMEYDDGDKKRGLPRTYFAMRRRKDAYNSCEYLHLDVGEWYTYAKKLATASSVVGSEEAIHQALTEVTGLSDWDDHS